MEPEGKDQEGYPDIERALESYNFFDDDLTKTIKTASANKQR